jgi:hypothetical protein
MRKPTIKEAIPTVSITKVKEPKTIKVKTLVTGIAFAVALIVSFIGGIIVSAHYTDTVHAQAVELSKHLK